MPQTGTYRRNLKLGQGLWTPYAKVWCAKCAKENRAPISDFENRGKPRHYEYGSGTIQGWCSDCGTEVWIDSKIAQEQRMVRALSAAGVPAEMDQTGGMCSAVVVHGPHEDFYINVFGDEESMEDYGANWMLGLFTEEDAECVDDAGNECFSFDDAVERVVALYTAIAH